MKIVLLVAILGLAYYGAFLPWVWHLDDGVEFSEQHRPATHFGVGALALGAPMIAYLGYRLLKLFYE